MSGIDYPIGFLWNIDQYNIIIMEINERNIKSLKKKNFNFKTAMSIL